jgi:hypothetical protein
MAMIEKCGRCWHAKAEHGGVCNHYGCDCICYLVPPPVAVHDQLDGRLRVERLGRSEMFLFHWEGVPAAILDKDVRIVANNGQLSPEAFAAIGFALVDPAYFAGLGK